MDAAADNCHALMLDVMEGQVGTHTGEEMDRSHCHCGLVPRNARQTENQWNGHIKKGTITNDAPALVLLPALAFAVPSAFPAGCRILSLYRI